MPTAKPTPREAIPGDTRPQPRRVYLETLGCAKNRVDSEIMLAALGNSGYAYTPDPQQAQVILVNTCAFLSAATAESIDRLLQLSEYKSTGRCEKLVCAGCMSERYRDSLMEEIPELDGMLGSSNFHEIPLLLDDLYSGVPNASVRLQSKPHYAHYSNQERVQTTPSPYTYLKIAEGCSNMCSFCNIPFLRGYFSSRSIEDIVAEQKGHVERGIREINVISQDTSSYGVDRNDGSSLAHLLRAMERVAGDYWIRLFYAYPNSFSDDTMDTIAQSTHILPYVDMPFQHIRDGVLRDMNRRITEVQIREKLERMRERIPALVLRTTFISGFPTESAADHLALLSFIEEGWFDHVGVFGYSHEDNIKSASLGDPVPAREKHARRAQLLDAQSRVSRRRNQSRVGQRYKVLVEGISEESELLLQGRGGFQGPEVDGLIYINEGVASAGEFHSVEITEAHPYDLVGKIAD